MPTLSPRRTAGYTIGAAGILIGLCTLVGTQLVVKDFFEPIQQKCSSGDTAQLHPFEPMLGGSFVCLITQFFVILATTSGGVFVWGTICGISIPVSLLFAVEAGRSGSKGLLTWPMVIGLLGQFLGISVVMPLLWLPSYVYGHSHDIKVHPARVLIALFLSSVFVSLSIAFAILPVDAHRWTVVAGLLGGPIIPLTGVLYWPFTTFNGPAETCTFAIIAGYTVAATLSFFGWVSNCYFLFREFGFSTEAIWGALWSDAHPCVKFMTIDTAVFFLAGVLHLGNQNWYDALEVSVVWPIVGPGAVLAYELAKQEHRRLTAYQKKEK